MKIQVVRVDGSIETISLVGTVTAHEPGNKLEYPRNQSPLHVAATGMDHFFREDGRYDGWGMACNLPTMDDAAALIDAVQEDREVSHD